MNELTVLPWWAWALIILLLGGQGTWLFLDARKKGRRAWLWGLLGLVNFPSASLLYWLVGVTSRRARKD